MLFRNMMRFYRFFSRSENISTNFAQLIEICNSNKIVNTFYLKKNTVPRPICEYFCYILRVLQAGVITRRITTVFTKDEELQFSFCHFINLNLQGFEVIALIVLSTVAVYTERKFVFSWEPKRESICN